MVVWGRTGSLSLTEAGPGEIPRRLVYPPSELSYNAANMPAATLYTPLIF